MKPTLSTPQGRLRHSTRGFTLIEIMLVVAIIAVLLGSAIYILGDNLGVAKIKRVEADVRTISTQLRAYEMLSLRLPTAAQGLESLVVRPVDGPQPRQWRQLLQEVPLDPWGNPYKYVAPAQRSKDAFDIYSFGPDGVESADDIGNY